MTVTVKDPARPVVGLDEKPVQLLRLLTTVRRYCDG